MFPLLALRSNAAVKFVYRFLWGHMFSFLGTDLLGHMVTLYLTVWGTARLPSKVAAPLYLRYSSI